MLKENYYYLVAGLPDLFFNENKTALSSSSFKNKLKSQLNKADFELVQLLYLKKEDKCLSDLFLEKNELSEDQDTEESGLTFENRMEGFYYEYVIASKNTFLSKWFKLELTIKNILTAFNCTQFNYPLEKHLVKAKQGKEVYSLLLKNQLKPELFEDEVPFAEQLFKMAESDSSPEEKEKAIDKLLWNYLDEQTFFYYFTIEQILSYIIKLRIVERWVKLDPEKGNTLLNKLIEELKHSYQFPEEFSIVK